MALKAGITDEGGTLQLGKKTIEELEINNY